ncbi:MAG: cytidylate kinase family protein [Candidatus Pacebacteria bacterium]|nr:cytidylate kinase family protein [Candidatus Paceibacterota bacterium]
MKKAIITIAGSLGSGKSSTAKAVAATLGYKHFSSGDLFRKIAAERGLSVEEMNITAEIQRDIDHQVDALLQDMNTSDDRLVIDSRMAWHWMPDSFKVFLTLDSETAATRVFAQIQSGGRVSEHGESLKEVRSSIERRLASEQKRYFDLYGVDPRNPSNFDLVIDTKENDLKTVVATVLQAYEQWRSA